MKFVVTIDSKFMETCATNSLIGYLVNEYGTEVFQEGCTIILEFEEKSYAWCKEHGGPDSWVMSEFSPRLLIEDIFSLQKRGLKIQTRVKKVNK